MEYLANCNIDNIYCVIDKNLSVNGIIFELLVLVFSIVAFVIVKKIKKNVWKRYFIMLIGVMCFEFVTAVMWRSNNLGQWAYIYRNISYIFTFWWVSQYLLVVSIVDKKFPYMREWIKYFIYIPINLIIGIAMEALVVKLQIRGYAPEIHNESMFFVPLLDMPIEVFYYMPVFSTLIITFYKYWIISMERVLFKEMSRKFKKRNIILTLVGIFLFELMIEPQVINTGFPEWTYLYLDITIVRMMLWTVMISVVIEVVDWLIARGNEIVKFFMYVIGVLIFFLPLEWYFMVNNYRSFSQSLISNFSSIEIPYLNMPVEYVLGMVFYLSLIIAFVRYWRLVLDNQI